MLISVSFLVRSGVPVGNSGCGLYPVGRFQYSAFHEVDGFGVGVGVGVGGMSGVGVGVGVGVGWVVSPILV